MDYGKSGNPKGDKNVPKHRVGKGLGAEKSATGGKASGAVWATPATNTPPITAARRPFIAPAFQM